MSESLARRKSALRRHLRKQRNEFADRSAASQAICDKLQSLPAYQAANVVMMYVDVRCEVETRELIRKEIGGSRCVVIPFCQGDELVPWELRNWTELSTGAFGILEPNVDLREAPSRCVEPGSIDLICVPGVGFDRAGNRLGSGRGYYDRLIPRLRPDAIKVGLAYECQIVPEIPIERHDIPMDILVTEAS